MESLEFDGDEGHLVSSDNIQNDQKYKYPKNLYSVIFPIDSDIEKEKSNSTANIFFREFSSEEKDNISCLSLQNLTLSNDSKTVKKVIFKLETTNLISKSTSNRNDSFKKLGLEDWLDGVL